MANPGNRFDIAYTEACKLYDDDDIEGVVAKAKAILGGGCPCYYHVNFLLLIASATDDWAYAQRCLEQAETLWTMLRGTHHIGDNDRMDRAIANLKSSLEMLKQENAKYAPSADELEELEELEELDDFEDSYALEEAEDDVNDDAEKDSEHDMLENSRELTEPYPQTLALRMKEEQDIFQDQRAPQKKSSDAVQQETSSK